MDDAPAPALMEQDFVNQGAYTYKAEGDLYNREQTLNLMLRGVEKLVRDATDDVTSADKLIAAVVKVTKQLSTLKYIMLEIKRGDDVQSARS